MDNGHEWMDSIEVATLLGSKYRLGSGSRLALQRAGVRIREERAPSGRVHRRWYHRRDVMRYLSRRTRRQSAGLDTVVEPSSSQLTIGDVETGEWHEAVEGNIDRLGAAVHELQGRMAALENVLRTIGKLALGEREEVVV